MKRILICGGRDFAKDCDDEKKAFCTAMAALAEKHGTDLLIINGGCLHGADRLARAIAVVWEVDCLTYNAKWKTEGKSAGPRRNQRMIDEARPDLVVAFPGGRGTADMVTRARAAGVPVWIPYPKASAFGQAITP